MEFDYRTHKRNLVLNLIITHGPVSRTELIEMTDYRPTTIGDITKELLEDKLIIETGKVSAGMGRKRVMLEINREFICAIGVTITPACVTTVIMQIDGVVRNRWKDIVNMADTRAAADAIVARIQEAVAACEGRLLVGIGIGDPENDPAYYRVERDQEKNFIHYNADVYSQIRPRLERETGVMVRNISGVTLPAIVEKRFGCAADASDFLCILLSNGFSAAICCDGHIHSGANGIAGEIGHSVCNTAESTQKLCYCGKKGCVETEAAFPAIVQNIRSAIDQGIYTSLDKNAEIDEAAIRHALEKNDPVCSYYVNRSAQQIGVAIANAVNLFDPELVVLYGSMLTLGADFVGQVELHIRKNVKMPHRKLKISLSPHLERDLPMGAASEMFNYYFKMEEYAALTH